MSGKDINVLALIRDGERYIFLYDDDSCQEMLQQLEIFAEDPQLSFSKEDAETLGGKVENVSLKSDKLHSDPFPNDPSPRFQFPL